MTLSNMVLLCNIIIEKCFFFFFKSQLREREREREREIVMWYRWYRGREGIRKRHSYVSLSGAPNAIAILLLLGVVWRFVQEKNCTITLSKTSSIMTCIIIIIIIYSIHSYHFYCLPCTCNKHFICISNLNMKHIIWAVYMCSRRYYKSLSKLSDNWPKLPRKMLIWLKMK